MVVIGAAASFGGCELAERPATATNAVCEPPLSQVNLPLELGETSGLASSQSHPGVFWTHNDSGGDAAVFAVDSTGSILGGAWLEGLTNRDWEDIAVGPCEPGGASCVFVADIGDNSEQHDRVAFYRFPEPDPQGDSAVAGVTTIRARYPDGPRDAEAVFVTDQGIHVVNKGRSDAIELFRLPPPYPTDSIGTFQQVQQLAPPPTSVSAQVTAAAASADGQRVVLRTYSGLRFFRSQGDTLAQWGRPAESPAPTQLQGEGVDWIDSQRLVLTSEKQGQQPPTLAVIRCDPERPAPADTTNAAP